MPHIFSCNTTDSTKTGIYFGGNNLGTKFRGNEMKKHNIGLYLNNTAVIDTQSHAGNMWTGLYNSNYGAWNENDSIVQYLQSSLFIVDPNLGATYNPKIPLGINPGEPNDQGWFQLDTGSTYSCAGYLLCEDMNSSLLQNGSVDLKEAIALDSVLSTDYKEESKSIAKISLYETLQKDSLTYSSNPVLMQFMSDNVNTSFGKLFNVEKLIKQSFAIDSLSAILMKEKDSLMSVHLNNVYVLDSIAATDSTVDNLTTRENELIIIKDLQQERTNIILQATDLLKLDNAKSINSSIQPSELPEYNLKKVNEVNIIYEENNKDSIAQYYATLVNIAEQCPFAGGKAVYMARGLVALFNDTIIYEDESNCLLQGYYRLQNVQSDVEENMEIRIIPNPANTFADVELKNSYEGICRITITDVYSKKLTEQTFDCKNRQYRIKTEKYMSGVYNVKIQVNDKIIKVARLIIVR